jgi:hypothetical protein
LIGSQVTDGELDEYSGRVPRDACATDISSSSCLRLRELQDRRNLLFNAGWGTLAASGALGAATVAVILLDSSKPHDGIRVVPIATGQHAGLTCYGAW